MRRFVLLLAAGLLASGIAVPSAAIAKSQTSAKSCVWRTYFHGAKDTYFDGPFRYRWFTGAPCFASQATCKKWLYNTQTEYPLMMDFRPCHTGR